MQNSKGGKIVGLKNGATTLIKTTNKSVIKQEKPKRASRPVRPVAQMHRNAGVRIGGGTVQDRWRCRVCSFMNEADSGECMTCHEEKTVRQQVSANRGINQR